MNDGFVVPPPLLPGDRVRVVAPSSPFDRALVLRGLAWLRERYDVLFDRELLTMHRSFAGTDARRRSELEQALADPATRAIVAARGGYGVTRILPAIDLAGLAAAPKWLVGFSDITALHVECTRIGVVSLHANNAAGLGRGDAHGRESWRAALEEPRSPRRFVGLSAWHGGHARGPLVGGNLTMLFTCAASGRLELPAGAVLAIEDIGEQSYRIDRMLTALTTSGLLDRVAAVIVGTFSDCPAGRFGLTAESVLRDRLSQLGVPVVAGMPFGHEGPNAPLHLGLEAVVDAGAGVVIAPAP